MNSRTTKRFRQMLAKLPSNIRNTEHPPQLDKVLDILSTLKDSLRTKHVGIDNDSTTKSTLKKWLENDSEQSRT